MKKQIRMKKELWDIIKDIIYIQEEIREEFVKPAFPQKLTSNKDKIMKTTKLR